jgi:hypothetical protein
MHNSAFLDIHNNENYDHDAWPLHIGLVNSSWASMREFSYFPGRVHIIASSTNGEDVSKATESLRVVLHGFGSPAEILIEQ